MLMVRGLLAKVLILVVTVAIIASITSYTFVSVQQTYSLSKTIEEIKLSHRQSAKLFIDEQLKELLISAEEIVMLSSLNAVDSDDLTELFNRVWPRIQLNFTLSSMAFSNSENLIKFGDFDLASNQKMLEFANATRGTQTGIICHNICELSSTLPIKINDEAWTLTLVSDLSPSVVLLSSVTGSDIGVLSKQQVTQSTNMSLSRYVVEFITGTERNHDLFRKNFTENELIELNSNGLQTKVNDVDYFIWLDTITGLGETLDLLIIKDISNIVASHNAQKKQVIVIFAVLTIGVLIFLMVFSIFPISKINQLKRATKLIGQKQYDVARYRIGNRRNYSITDELQELEEEFRQTIDILESYEHQLAFSQKKLVKQATIDAITGLYTRNVLVEDLWNMNTDDSIENVAIFFLDLDGFKPVNDNLGHEAGDIMLKKIGYRLKGVVNKSTKVYRIGGDEFVICRSNYMNNEFLDNTADALVDLFSAPFHIYDTSISISASIGIAMQTAHNIDADQILRYADIAMYQAKEDGKNRYRFFDDSMRDAAQKRFTIKNDFTSSLNAKELFVVYQPIVCSKTKKVIKLEALCRWEHPELGYISPLLFIDVLEESENMNILFEWLIDSVIQELEELEAQGYGSTIISVNLSTSQLVNDTALYVLQEKILQFKVDPSKIELEITETSLITNFTKAKVWIEQATQFGFRIAIDDFGAGYSSLSYLTAFPYNTVKLDRSLLNFIDSDMRQQRIVGSLTQMLHGLGVPIVAEGAETNEQFDVLAKLGCDYIQGFLISKPIKNKALISWLRNHCESSQV